MLEAFIPPSPVRNLTTGEKNKFLASNGSKELELMNSRIEYSFLLQASMKERKRERETTEAM